MAVPSFADLFSGQNLLGTGLGGQQLTPDAQGNATPQLGGGLGANTLVGLGMGLLQPWAQGSSPWANALPAYQAGAQADALNAYRTAQLRQQQEEMKLARDKMAQQESQFQQTFKRGGLPTVEWQEDEWGRKYPVWVNREAQTITPGMVGGASSADVGAVSPGGGAIGPGTPPAGVNQMVDAMLAGRMAPPSSFAASKPFWQQIIARAAEKEPGFDFTTWGQRYKAAGDFGSGVAARNVTSLNTVIGHMGDLMDKAQALDNSNFIPANQFKNWLVTNAGKPEVNNFNLARNAVADEMARVFRSQGMSDTEIRSWKETLSAANSPVQLKEAVNTGVNLLQSRVDALGDQYERAMGKRKELVSPKAQATIDKIREWKVGPSDQPQTAPGAAAQTWTDPETGKTYKVRDGRLYE